MGQLMEFRPKLASAAAQCVIDGFFGMPPKTFLSAYLKQPAETPSSLFGSASVIRPGHCYQKREILQEFLFLVTAIMHKLKFLVLPTTWPTMRYTTWSFLFAVLRRGKYSMDGSSSASSAVLPSVPDGPSALPATILIVEDDSGVLGLLEAILSRPGYTVMTAEDGEDALRVCNEHGIKVDLLIADVVMPGMSGHELAEAFKASQPAMKVLYMSGWPMGSGTYRAIEEGRLNFIAKPFSADSISAKVRSILA